LLKTKNELLEFKNDFVQMKNLLMHKRNPDDKIEKELNELENGDKKVENKEVVDGAQGDKTENNKEENKSEINKKRIKKIIKKNIKKKEEKQENQNKEKGEGNNKQINNKHIADYFSLSGKKEQNPMQNDNNMKENETSKDLNINQVDQEQAGTNTESTEKESIKEINKYLNNDDNNPLSLEPNNEIKYDNAYLNNIKNIPEKINDFYCMNSETINETNKNEYLLKLKNYLIEYNSINNIAQNDNSIQKRKLIFIHNCYRQIKKIPNVTSNLINPRNYLAKDEYLIDYDKDSEDEYMEENAEDIKSNDNEDIEEEDEEDANSQQDDKFIVPDGHLSEEELSDKNIMEERQLLENSKEKILDMMNILNIRKNFARPVLVDFTNNRKNDEKINILSDKLTIGLFNFEDDNANDSTVMDIEANMNGEQEAEKVQNNSFPIVIGNKVTKYKGIVDSIKIHFEDILRKVHGSYETKEHLINELNQKYEDISKKALNSFFKDKCYKIQKKYWMVSNDTLSKFNIKEEDIEQIKKDNLEIYKIKEEKRKKELDEIKIKDGIIPAQSAEEGNIKTDNNTNDENKKEKDNNDNNKVKDKKHKGKSKSKSNSNNNSNNKIDNFMKEVQNLFSNKINNTQEQNQTSNNISKKEAIFELKKMTEQEKKKDIINNSIEYKNQMNEDIEMNIDNKKEEEKTNIIFKNIKEENNEKEKSDMKTKGKSKERNKSKKRNSNSKENQKEDKKENKKDRKKSHKRENIKEDNEKDKKENSEENNINNKKSKSKSKSKCQKDQENKSKKGEKKGKEKEKEKEEKTEEVNESKTEDKKENRKSKKREKKDDNESRVDEKKREKKEKKDKKEKKEEKKEEKERKSSEKGKDKNEDKKEHKREKSKDKRESKKRHKSEDKKSEKSETKKDAEDKMDIISENEHDKAELLKDKSNNLTKSKSRSKARKQENINNKSITEYFANQKNH